MIHCSRPRLAVMVAVAAHLGKPLFRSWSQPAGTGLKALKGRNLQSKQCY